MEKYALNDIHWIASEDGKILMPFVSIDIEGESYYLNLKDRVIVKKQYDLQVDVTKKYGIENLKSYESIDFLIQYESSNVNNLYINMLANELFEPITEKTGNNKDINIFMDLYYDFMDNYKMGIWNIKKFSLFAKQVIKVLHRHNLKEERKKGSR